MPSPAPQPARPRRPVRLDLTLSGCEFGPDQITAFASITGGILLANTVYACGGSIEAINGDTRDRINNAILVIDVEKDCTRGTARLIFEPNGPRIDQDRLDANVLRIEFAVSNQINSKDHAVKFDQPIQTLTEALK